MYLYNYEGVYFLLWRDILLLEGGASLWRVYGYYYEELYFYVRGILFAVEGYTFVCGRAHVYGGCIITKGCIFVLWVYFWLWRDILLFEGGTVF